MFAPSPPQVNVGRYDHMVNYGPKSFLKTETFVHCMDTSNSIKLEVAMNGSQRLSSHVFIYKFVSRMIRYISILKTSLSNRSFK